MLKILCGAALAVVALVGIGGYVFYTRPLRIAAGTPVIPEIGRNLPGDPGAANEEFNRRVVAEFPVPMPQSVFIARIGKQGFTIASGGQTASFEKPGFPCMEDWSLSWTAKDGILTSLKARYSLVCL